MNNIEIHDAATQLAAGRTTYSLARELLGVRAELAQLRTEAADASLLRTEAADASLLRGAYVRACEELSELKAALVEEGEPVPVGPALSLVHRLKEERAQLRDTLANMEAEEGQEITALRESLDEARAVLVNAMAIDPAELEPPIRKEHRDYHAAQQMERKDLEQRYALARMTARLSMAKAADLEQQLAQLQDAARRQSGLLERKERDLDTAQQQTDRAIVQGQELAAQPDEAQGLVIQLTASAFNLRNRCKELEAALPAPREVRRTGDQSIELTFHSCRLAGEFERFITAQGETPA